MSTLSFTGERQVRFPAPDVARGFMLALIALANAALLGELFPEHPRAGFAALDAMTSADQWWFLVRAMLVDRRALPPLFDPLRLRHGDHGPAHDRA